MLQNTNKVLSNCYITQYTIYPKISSIQYKEKGEEEQKKHVIGDISIFGQRCVHVGITTTPRQLSGCDCHVAISTMLLLRARGVWEDEGGVTIML